MLLLNRVSCRNVAPVSPLDRGRRVALLAAVLLAHGALWWAVHHDQESVSSQAVARPSAEPSSVLMLSLWPASVAPSSRPAKASKELPISELTPLTRPSPPLVAGPAPDDIRLVPLPHVAAASVSPVSLSAAVAGPPEPVRVAPPSAEAAPRLSQAARPLPGNSLPRYPEAAREDGLEGTVRLMVEVAADGRVGTVRWALRSGVALLDQAARDAVRLWRFQPALQDGEPVAAVVAVTLQFRLQGQTVWLAQAGTG